MSDKIVLGENDIAYHATASLYKVPTLKKNSGKKSPVWLAPKAITAIYETEIETGGNEYGELMTSQMTKVTAVVTSEGQYFVPLTPTDLAALLHLDLVQ